MQRVGDGLTDYSKSSDSFLGKAAGIAGGVYTNVGCAFQGDEKNPDPIAKACPPSDAASGSSK